MITSFFKKSTILNNGLIVVLLFLFFFLYQTSSLVVPTEANTTLRYSVLILLSLASFFIASFSVKKNGLTKDSAFVVLFLLIFLLLFPSAFNNLNLVSANFFVLLALRRLISLQTLKTPKQKIFDASVWIFVASLFHFWCILFIILVYVSIIFHVSRDFRNWLIPFVAFFITIVVFILVSFAFDETWIDYLFNQSRINFKIDYFKNEYQSIAFILYMVFSVYFLFAMIFSLAHKPLILQASFKKMLFGFVIGIVIFFLSPDKYNSTLIFTFMPLSVLCTNNVEYAKSKRYQDIVVLILMASAFFTFFSQL